METEFVSTRRFTQDEFEHWVLAGRTPSARYRYELIHGHVVMEPPASYEHGELDARISRLLGNAVEAAGNVGTVFGSSAGFTLPTGDTLEPDAAFVSRERLLATAAVQRRDAFVRAVPDLVVEILSPSTRQRDATEKLEIYRKSGVREYWLLDAMRCEVIQVRFEPSGGVRNILCIGDRLTSVVIPNLSVDIATLLGGAR